MKGQLLLPEADGLVFVMVSAKAFVEGCVLE